MTGPTPATMLVGEHVMQQDEEIITGLLRVRRVMQVTGGSKTGKTQGLVELTYALADGGFWLGRFEVPHSFRVAYFNLEVPESEFSKRLDDVRKALHPREGCEAMVDVYSLRGQVCSIDEVADAIRESGYTYDVIILDPLYQLNAGDENSARDMRDLTMGITALVNETGASVVYSHHHAKGAAGARSAIDRGSGSGVLARFYDAHVDISPLEITTDAAREYCERTTREGARPTPCRVEAIVRGFAQPEPFDVWYRYPTHDLDVQGVLADCPVVGSMEAARLKGGQTRRAQVADEWAVKNDRIAKAIEQCDDIGEPPTRKAVYNRYVELCEAEDTVAPGFETFEKWTKASGMSAFRVDTEAGYILVRKADAS